MQESLAEGSRMRGSRGFASSYGVHAIRGRYHLSSISSTQKELLVLSLIMAVDEIDGMALVPLETPVLKVSRPVAVRSNLPGIDPTLEMLTS